MAPINVKHVASAAFDFGGSREVLALEAGMGVTQQLWGSPWFLRNQKKGMNNLQSWNLEILITGIRTGGRKKKHTENERIVVAGRYLRELSLTKGLFRFEPRSVLLIQGMWMTQHQQQHDKHSQNHPPQNHWNPYVLEV